MISRSDDRGARGGWLRAIGDGVDGESGSTCSEYLRKSGIGGVEPQLERFAEFGIGCKDACEM